ncbi:MAG TPA: tRNA pseudouridine(55) synthase TruB [Xanthobacteraceae bacterium]|nr:tRNA pseudouridine(55) synthase TruB [Xanthobacteraceae bacterium]
MSDTPLPNPPPQGGTEHAGPRGQPKREKRDVDGWVVLDKPVGMTSTHAVAVVKRAFKAKKAGHAGTLDPLASGILPIALGEATKTVPFVMEGRKAYRFTVRWGIETDTDDAEGTPVAQSDARPDAEAIRAALPRFTGAIMQTPPKYSAVKIAGERAYDLARAGEEVAIEPRAVEIGRLELAATPDADHAEFQAECGKGTYVRALARDLGRTLGTHGHVVALRRTAVGPFSESIAVGLEGLPAGDDAPHVFPETSALQPVAAGLANVPSLAVSRADAARLARGQPVLLRGRDAPVLKGWVAVTAERQLVALAEAAEGEILPRRIFNLHGAVNRAR